MQYIIYHEEQIMEFVFNKPLKEKPTTDQLLVSSKTCLEALIKNSREYNIKNFLKEPAKYTLALALVTDGRYAEFSAPKADYKLLIMVAEEIDGSWIIHQFLCDLNSKNMQRIGNINKEPIEPNSLNLATQGEIIFYERGFSHIASNRMARLEVNKNRKFTSEKNILDIYNSITKISANYHVAVLS